MATTMNDVKVATAENLAQGSIICLITQTGLAVGPVPSSNDMSQLCPALIPIGFLTAAFQSRVVIDTVYYEGTYSYALVGSQDQEVQWERPKGVSYC